MTDNVSGLPRRGQTYYGEKTILDADVGRSAGLEGTTKLFSDMDVATAAGIKTKRSGRMVKCMLVRNVGGFTMLPKRLVTWKSGARGKQVDGYADVTDEQPAGVVDEHIGSNGVPDNHLFWLTVQGPTLCLTSLSGDVTNVIVENDIMLALTAVTSGSTTAGRLYADTSVDATQVTKMVGYAMSAKTTTNTNADLLVDICTMKTL